jgi:NitT/TauT family transport system substrate-binding protein
MTLMDRRAVLAAVAASALVRPARARAQAVEKIRIAAVPTEDLTSLWYGIRNGNFQRAGIEVEVVSTSSGAAATTAMLAGTYDLAKPSLMAVFSAYLRNVPIVVVAPGFVHTPAHPNSLLQVAADAPLRTAADLNGKTMGTPALNDVASCAIRSWMDKNGGDWRSLKAVEVPNAALEEALVRRRIDIASMTSPALDLSLAAGTTRTIGDGYGSIAQIMMLAAYVGRPDWVAQHGDALRRFNRALREAASYVNTHLPETAPLVIEMTKMEAVTLAKMNRTVVATELDARLVQPLIDAAVKYGELPRSFPAQDLLWKER